MALIDVIKNNSNIRKIFGKKELEIINKQLLGIKLMPSEITRLSRDIRKKFEAIKELAIYSDEFKIKKGLEVNKIIQETLEVIKENVLFKDIKRIILFGSTKNKERTFRSDIDIGVEFEKIDKQKATEFRVWALSRVSRGVDIQVLNFLPEKILDSILKNYKVLYEK
jgi:predicted nucleotidyltransferase